MPPKTTPMSSRAIEELIAQRMADAMIDYLANRNSGTGINKKASGNAGGGEPTTRSCSYKEFLNCKPRNFNGTEGAVGLTRLFEKMEYVFHIYNCAENCQVKYDTSTLLDGALTWWTIYSLLDLELTLLYPGMVTPEYKKIKRYIWGLIDDILGNVTSLSLTNILEAIRMAHDLIDQVVRASTAKNVENKRKWDNN
ncbi:hypothetical protein Tco_1161818 [Tanacetum coccineum]